MQALKAKVIFLGETGIGKTVLTQRIASNTYMETTHSTVASSLFTIEVTSESGEPIQLQIWDTAGQERFRSLTQTYFRRSDVAVVCHKPDGRGIIEWARSIREAEPTCRIFTVLTKIDLYDEREVTQALAMAGEIGVEFGGKCFATSAKSGQGVEDLVREIAKEVVTKETNAKVIVQNENKTEECC
jgi:small GTP-binding protein